MSDDIKFARKGALRGWRLSLGRHRYCTRLPRGFPREKACLSLLGAPSRPVYSPQPILHAEDSPLQILTGCVISMMALWVS